MAAMKKVFVIFLTLLLLLSVPFQALATTSVRYIQHGARDEKQNQLIQYWLYLPPASNEATGRSGFAWPYSRRIG